MTLRNKFEPAHSPFGGSVAARVLRCPASVHLVQKVPAELRKPSFFASRGAALHAAMALLLDDSGPPLESLVGKTFNDYAITRDDIASAVRPALAYVDALLDTPGCEFYLEHRVEFPHVAGAHGTADLLARIGRTAHVVDYKFGIGVRVLALSPADDDPTEDVINGQLLFYAAAARNSLPQFFAEVESIVLTIVQPMSTDADAKMLSSVAVTDSELDLFVAAYRDACAEALAPAPRLQKGPWCRFCSAKPICPAHTAPLLDLAQFQTPVLSTGVSASFAKPPAKATYLQLLANGLNLVDAIKDLRTALHDQAKLALEHGDVVPGYALSAGRAERRWRDDEHTTIAALESLGLERDDIVAEALRSPAQVERRAKARSVKIPPELISSARSGVSLVRSENAHFPVPGRDELVRSFSAALKAFEEEARP